MRANVESIRPPHEASVQNVRKMQSMARPLAWPGLRLAARIGLTVRYWVPSPVSSKRPRLAPHGQRGFSLWAAARVAGLFCNER